MTVRVIIMIRVVMMISMIRIIMVLMVMMMMTILLMICVVNTQQRCSLELIMVDTDRRTLMCWRTPLKT